MAGERPGGYLRIFQNTDAAGRPDPREYGRVIPYEGLRSLTETVMDFLRPLSPRETDQLGVFWYTDPAHGSGWLRMEGFSRTVVEEVQQAVRTLAISAAIGQPEPIRQEVLSFGNAIVLRTTNPYIKIGFGGIVLLIALLGLLRVATMTGDDVARAVAAVVMVALAVVCVILIIQGLLRRAWWHRARAEAKRQGVALPDQIKVWN